MEDCIFCKIVKGDIPSEKVFENENILGFKDINPMAPIHILIIPKKHITSLDSIEQEDITLIGELMINIKVIAKEQGLSENGYRVVTNIGDEGGQEVKHLHFHLLGGRQMLGTLG